LPQKNFLFAQELFSLQQEVNYYCQKNILVVRKRLLLKQKNRVTRIFRQCIKETFLGIKNHLSVGEKIFS